MNRPILSKTLRVCIIPAIIMMFLSGCGRDAALDEYKQNMEAYYEGIARIDSGINSIDPATDTDGAKLLEYLDALNTITGDMAELTVPKQFEIVESLADEAADNMSKAVTLYHQLYESEEYNEDVASGAYEYYERANLRIRYIKDILHGEMPEELVVVEDSGQDTAPEPAEGESAE